MNYGNLGNFWEERFNFMKMPSSANCSKYKEQQEEKHQSTESKRHATTWKRNVPIKSGKRIFLYNFFLKMWNQPFIDEKTAFEKPSLQKGEPLKERALTVQDKI